MTRLHYNYTELMNVVARLRDLGDIVLEVTMGLPRGEWKVQRDSVHDLYVVAAKLEASARRVYAEDVYSGWLVLRTGRVVAPQDAPDAVPLALEVPMRAQGYVPTNWIPAAVRARRLEDVGAELVVIARRLDSGGIAEPKLGPAVAGDVMALRNVIGADADRMLRCAAELDAAGGVTPIPAPPFLG
ncbi:hypothetical protein PP352_25045 [Mycobacteroides abscessus]|nr:hypothetical protein [Mycobacteroides abscessus]